MVYTLCFRFYPEESAERAMAFSSNVLQHQSEVSPAQVQGLFMFYKDDPQGAIDNAQYTVNL